MNQDGSNQNEKKIDISLDGADDVDEAIGKGMDALKQVFGGFVNMAQEMMGPQGMRNLEASQWLSQIAGTLDEIAKSLKEQATVSAGRAGQLTCFLERAEAETQGSKFEMQLDSFQKRLQEALEIVQRADGAEKLALEREAARLAESAGYFSAAAATAMPVNGSGEGQP